MGLKLLAGTEGGYAIFRDRAAAEVAYLYGRHRVARTMTCMPAYRPRACLIRSSWAGDLPVSVPCWCSSTCPICAMKSRRAVVTLPICASSWRPMAFGSYRKSVTAMPMPITYCRYWRQHLLHPDQRAAAIQVLQRGGVTAFAYLPAPIPALAKMDVVLDEPPLFWRQPLRQAGFQPKDFPSPVTQRRLSRSLEMVFNWYLDDRQAMEAIAAHLRAAAAAVLEMGGVANHADKPSG